MTRVRLLVLILVAAVVWGDSSAQTDPVLEEEQRSLESGADLGSAAQRVLFKARGKQDKQDFTGAVEVVKKWLEGKPEREHHLLRFNLALSYFALEDPDQALLHLKLAVKESPRFGRAWLRLGEAAYGAGYFAEAADAFTRSYELSPDKHPEILYYSGAAWLMADQPIQALGTMERLIRGFPDEVRVDWYQALVAAAITAERPARAAPWMDRLLAGHADEPAAWELAYRFAASRDDYRQAVICLTITGYLREHTRSELVQLGDLLSVIEEPMQAARCYEKAMALSVAEENNGVVDKARRAEQFERMASAWLAAHEFDRARSALNQALAEQESVRLWALVGDLEYLQGNFQAALDAFGKCLRLSAEFGRGWLMMGYCALELDRPDEARGYLEKAAAFPDQAGSARGLMNRL